MSFFRATSFEGICMFYRPGASTGRKLNKSRRRVGATGAAIGLAAALTVTGATSATADVEELPPLVYSSHNFNDLEWEVSRKAPAVFEPGTDSLLIEVDRTDRGGTPYSWQEGMVADLPPTVDADGDRDIVSVRATVYVDPAWENIETSADRSGFDTSFEAGLWLSVPYHPSYPGQSAWPTVLLRNDHRTTENVPVANVFDTTNREDPLLIEDPISVAYGDQVTLEIRFDRETYTYYYFANDELIFEHEWWEDSGFPLEQIYFFTFNSGMPEDDDDDDVATSVQVQWSNLEFGTEAYPAAINDETVPDGTVGVAYSHAFDIDSEIDFTATASDLPNGLELSADGVLSGTPTTAGSHTFTVAVDNGARPQEGVDSEREYTIEIAEGAFEGDVEYEFEFDGDQAVVGGSVTLGQIGQLTPTPDSVTFQWFRDGAPIEGA